MGSAISTLMESDTERIGEQLFEACMERDEAEVLRILRTEEGSIECRDDLGQNILQYAACLDLPSVVEEVISSDQGRGLILQKSKHGHTPLHPPCAKGNLPVVRALIRTEQGRAAILEGDRAGDTPLHDAARNGHDDVVGVLLETEEGQRAAGVRNGDGRTPRDLAEETRHTSTVAVFDELC